MKREELLFRDQHHSEEYSLDLVPFFVDQKYLRTPVLDSDEAFNKTQFFMSLN